MGTALTALRTVARYDIVCWLLSGEDARPRGARIRDEELVGSFHGSWFMCVACLGCVVMHIDCIQSDFSSAR